MMSSRERINLTLNHIKPDRVPFGLGSGFETGMHVSMVYKLRQALGLDEPGTPVKVIEPMQMLGEIGYDLMELLRIDLVGLSGKRTFLGFSNEGWKQWTMFDGTPVLVPHAFNTDLEPNGYLLMYPEGDKKASPCARMPNGGWYFDPIPNPLPSDIRLNIEDNLVEFTEISDDEVNYFEQEVNRLINDTDKAIFADFGSTNFGDVALVPGTWLKNPRGIRDIQEWLISIVTRPNYIKEIFEYQCEIALENLKKIYRVIGNKISIVYSSGNDFGMQTGLLISRKSYLDLYQPYSRRINDWIHQNTQWKTFIHSCGAIKTLIEDFIVTGFDVLNPVQTSASDMDPQELKKLFGDRIVFFGGGVDTQRTLPFGTPDEVRREVRDRLKIFGRGGGYIFNPIHNIQPNIPIENLMAMIDTLLKQ